MPALVEPAEAAAAPAPRAGRWADLSLRVASAAVLAPLALAAVWFGGIAWIVLVLVAAWTLAAEWCGLCRLPVAGWPGGLVLLSTLLAAALAVTGWPGMALAVVALGFVGAVSVHRWLGLGVVYLGIPVIALCVLRADQAGRLDLLFLLLVVWASDIGAYFVGRVVGGARLAPSISPGKTRSGAVGGLLIAVVAGAGMAAFLGSGGIALAAMLAGVLSVVSQAGDLFESWVKRRFGVKDSGRSIPGHGGVLDRLDGLMAAAPVLALLAWAGQGAIAWR